VDLDKKISKEIVDLNNTVDKMNSANSYRTFHLKATEYTLFKYTWGLEKWLSGRVSTLQNQSHEFKPQFHTHTHTHPKNQVHLGHSPFPRIDPMLGLKTSLKFKTSASFPTARIGN
jgi:hypothetical protein